jgi:hypothetical protein
MRRKSFAALFLATLCLSPGLAGAQTTLYPVSIKIDNGYPGAAVTSDIRFTGDTGEPYVSSPQLEAVINGNSGDLLFGLNSSKLKPARYLWLDLGSWSRVTPLPFCPVESPMKISLLNGQFPCQPFVNVNAILSVPVSQTQPRGAIFNYTGYGEVRLGSQGNRNFCSGQVLVTHTINGFGKHTWVIESPVQTNPVAYANGIAVVDQDYSTSRTVDWKAVAYVNLPFKLTVTALQ